MAATVNTSRRVRAFKRWMKSKGFECSDALQITDIPYEGLAVRALCDLQEGDVVATIPKLACLTINTTAASDLIEAASFDGFLGLSVALMYERSLGDLSPWAPYLQLLPQRECLPLVWTLEEVDRLLSGTELHKTVKEDKALNYEDWKENILPLMGSDLLKLDPNFFGFEQYFEAKTLVASRSFQIDDYHGSGMVPLADIFNHKTAAEDVHFTSISPHSESDDEADCGSTNEASDIIDDESTNLSSPVHSNGIATVPVGTDSGSDTDVESPSVLGEDSAAMEMIMVKDVKAGAEVFNTYGSLGNAALLHRYGFTEPDNPYDIVNIDLELVLQWSLSLFSSRYSRTRISLWRRLNYSGCISENSEYFEISFDGEPQVELLVLLYVMFLPEDAYCKLDFAVSNAGNLNEPIGMLFSDKSKQLREETPEGIKDLLLTKSVRNALLSLADKRGGLYGSNSIKDDMKALGRCCYITEQKLYHSLMLRISERKIIEKLRNYAAAGSGSRLKATKRSSMRKKMKRT